MEEIDIIESKISLLQSSIEFEKIIDLYLSENFPSEEKEKIDLLGFRKDKIKQLQYRFSQVYNMDILRVENGYSILRVDSPEGISIKKYLHRFLSYKSLTGGENANTDGSAALFEEISANAVVNYIGKGAKFIMVGEGRENLTPEILNQITGKLFEKSGIYHNLPGKAKDDGVDFIVYKPLDDRNIGNLIVLGQACVGKHYIHKKPIYDRWKSEYIPFAVRPPITLLSVVYFLEPDKLRRVHSDFNNSVVFDKGRILKYFNSTDPELNHKIIQFVDTNINEE